LITYKDLQSYKNKNPWRKEDSLWLLTEKELEQLPSGTIVESINGKLKTIGTDKVDTETRGGYIAFGLREKTIEET